MLLADGRWVPIFFWAVYRSWSEKRADELDLFAIIAGQLNPIGEINSFQSSIHSSPLRCVRLRSQIEWSNRVKKKLSHIHSTSLTCSRPIYSNPITRGLSWQKVGVMHTYYNKDFLSLYYIYAAKHARHPLSSAWLADLKDWNSRLSHGELSFTFNYTHFFFSSRNFDGMLFLLPHSFRTQQHLLTSFEAESGLKFGHALYTIIDNASFFHSHFSPDHCSTSELKFTYSQNEWKHTERMKNRKRNSNVAVKCERD